MKKGIVQKNYDKRIIRKKLRLIQKTAFDNGLDYVQMKHLDFIYNYMEQKDKWTNMKRLICGVIICWLSITTWNLMGYFWSTRCLLPSNYIVWEATRPLANCGYCENLTGPVILWNVTKTHFFKHVHSTGPIIIKKALKDWKATKEFSFKMLKNIYEETAGSYESFEDGCQFLNFKTDLFSLKEVFNMPEERIRNEPGQTPWYVGWSNCHPDVLSKIRQYYKVPDFLPNDAEFPATENIFFGYEIGAVMHLDYISRIMWQGQVKGCKQWTIAPVPECDHICQSLSFYVEEGDIVTLDTRIWYHATKIPKGQFSITVQSEYG